jgi:hypothetical protein
VLARLDARSEALALCAREPAAVVDALARLAERLHRRGVDHGDLKATHVFLDDAARSRRALLIDLEGVRFPRRLPAHRRRAALAELNASLPDDVPAALRRAAFLRYALVHPLPEGPRAALAAIARASVARRHRWTGADCACTAAERAGPARETSAASP